MTTEESLRLLADIADRALEVARLTCEQSDRRFAVGDSLATSWAKLKPIYEDLWERLKSATAANAGSDIPPGLQSSLNGLHAIVRSTVIAAGKAEEHELRPQCGNFLGNWVAIGTEAHNLTVECERTATTPERTSSSGESAFLGLDIDRERRTVCKNGYIPAEFGNKGKPWQLFLLIYDAGETGITRDEIFAQIWNPENNTNLPDKNK